MCIMFRDKWIIRFFKFPFCSDFSLHLHKMVEEISRNIKRAETICENIVSQYQTLVSSFPRETTFRHRRPKTEFMTGPHSNNKRSLLRFRSTTAPTNRGWSTCGFSWMFTCKVMVIKSYYYFWKITWLNDILSLNRDKQNSWQKIIKWCNEWTAGNVCDFESYVYFINMNCTFK